MGDINLLIIREPLMNTRILFNCAALPAARFIRLLEANIDCARENMEVSAGIFSPLGVMARLARGGEPMMKAVDLSIRRNTVEESERVARALRIEAKAFNPDYLLSMMELRTVLGKDRGDYQKGVWENRWTSPAEYPGAVSSIEFYLETRTGVWNGYAEVNADSGVRCFDVVTFKEGRVDPRRHQALIPLRLVK